MVKQGRCRPGPGRARSRASAGCVAAPLASCRRSWGSVPPALARRAAAARDPAAARRGHERLARRRARRGARRRRERARRRARVPVGPGVARAAAGRGARARPRPAARLRLGLPGALGGCRCDLPGLGAGGVAERVLAAYDACATRSASRELGRAACPPSRPRGVQEQVGSVTGALGVVYPAFWVIARGRAGAGERGAAAPLPAAHATRAGSRTASSRGCASRCRW